MISLPVKTYYKLSFRFRIHILYYCIIYSSLSLTSNFQNEHTFAKNGTNIFSKYQILTLYYITHNIIM